MIERVAADVAVVGAGPAGIAAAVRAAESGAKVVVVDDSPQAGGQIWKHRRRNDAPRRARRWIERFARCGARLVRAQVMAASDGRLSAETLPAGGPALEIQSSKLVLATGARERFLPFPGWTLPNVIGVGAAQALTKSGARFHGLRVVVAGSGPLLLPAAAALSAAGAKVSLVAEQAPFASVARFAAGLALRPEKLVQAALYRARFLAAAYRTGTWVAEARGEGSVAEVVVTDGRTHRTLPCDVLCCGYGLVPNLELPMLLGCAIAYGRVIVDGQQRTDRDGIFAAGELTGVGGVDLALVEGEIAGLAAAGKAVPPSLRRRARRRASFAAMLEHAFALRQDLKGLARTDTIVCRCEDVAFQSLEPSWTRRQAKLYGRAGMGPCQGKVCGPALEFLFDWEADSVRVPLRPVKLENLAAINGER